MAFQPNPVGQQPLTQSNDRQNSAGQHQAVKNIQDWGNRNYATGKERLMRNSEKDTEVWEILTDVPLCPGLWPYICMFFNIFVPGIGTMIAGCVGNSRAWSKTQIMVGLFQMLLSVYIVGWIWSIYWGVLLIKRSRKENGEVEKFIQKTQAKSDEIN